MGLRSLKNKNKKLVGSHNSGKVWAPNPKIIFFAKLHKKNYGYNFKKC
jgi:hypothetical protein